MNLSDAELHAPLGKFRIIREDELGSKDVERDLDSLDGAKSYVNQFPGWGWQVRDDQAQILYSKLLTFNPIY